MAAPLELRCWGGGWGLPSVHSESLVVMVRPPRGPGRGKKGAGPETRGWLVRVPAAGVGSRRARARPAGSLFAAPPGAPSRPTSYSLACGPAKSWRRSHGFSAWLRVFSALQSRLCSGMKAQSSRRALPALHPSNVWGEKSPRNLGSAQPRLEVAGGTQPPSQAFLPSGDPALK